MNYVTNYIIITLKYIKFKINQNLKYFIIDLFKTIRFFFKLTTNGKY